MKPKVKATAIRVLTHSSKDLDIMHRTMASELGEEYTPEDRALLESLVVDAHKRLAEKIKRL